MLFLYQFASDREANLANVSGCITSGCVNDSCFGNYLVAESDAFVLQISPTQIVSLSVHEMVMMVASMINA